MVENKDIIEYKKIHVDQLELLDYNPNELSEIEMENLKRTIRERGFKDPVNVVPKPKSDKYIVIDGAHRVVIMVGLGRKLIPCVVQPFQSEQDIKIDLVNLNRRWGEFNTKKYALLLQSLQADYDNEQLASLINIDVAELEAYAALLRKEEFDEKEIGKAGSLTNDYLVPPFSVLDTRRVGWLNRKREWWRLLDLKDLGKSREGLLKMSKTASMVKKTQYKQAYAEGKEATIRSRDSGKAPIAANVSIFDPVLAEILYLWFCPQSGVIFDPFAGDVSQSMVAALKGYQFRGIELRQEQIDVHLSIAAKLSIKEKVEFFCDDAINLEKHIKPESVDFLFTCPPYYDLEQYSELEEDLSNLTEEQFDEKYAAIIKKAAITLKDNRFACFVVGEVRRKGGIGAYKGLVPKTIKACEEAGLQYYNELILVNSVGTLPLRIRKIWEARRKTGKMHQNVLVFFKGDMKNFKELQEKLVKQELKDVLKEETEKAKDEVVLDE